MIAALSKAIVLYLAPLLALTSIILTSIGVLAPTFFLHDQVTLLTVGSSSSVDGPTLFLGFLGSCSRTNNAASINCTPASLAPIYDLSVLPQQSPQLLLTAPTTSTPVFMFISLALSILFFLLFTMTSCRHKLGDRVSNVLDKPLIHRACAWIGFSGFFIGITSFLIIRMWYGKAADDFNNSVQSLGGQSAGLNASLGTAFTLAWVAYAFYGIPLILSMSKMNVTATK